MEDEECLPENSSLKIYLENLGFSDLQVTKNVSSNPSNIRFEVVKEKSKRIYTETIDEDVIDQISIIVSTQMLFEEDISNVEKLLSNFQVVRNGMFKRMFKDFYSIAIIFLGLCLHCIIGYYAFFIVSSFYAFMAADYLRCKHFIRKRLKKLTSILQTNFQLLKKTVKFIEENKLIEVNSSCKNNSAEFMEGFDFYKNFKSDFLVSLNEIITVLTQSTQKLINQIPLHDYIENPEYYLCNNFNKNYEFVDLSKLYEVYLLVQSEFLQRLILSLIPNIKLSPKDSFHDLNDILVETCLSLLKIKNKLSKKYKFLFLNGIHSPKMKASFKIPLRNGSKNNYYNEFMLNIHETSKIFQKLLIQCRILEEKIAFEKIPEFVEDELVKMQGDLYACQKNIDNSLILFKKSNYITQNPNKHGEIKMQEEEEARNTARTMNKVTVGYTDLDPEIEDEIFEAYFTHENSRKNLADLDDWNLDNKLEKQLAKEFSENVLKELKLKIVEKAEYWKKKEKELLKQKGITDANGDVLQEENIDRFKEIVNNVEETDLQLPIECLKIKPEKNDMNYTKGIINPEVLNNKENGERIDKNNFSKETMPDCTHEFQVFEANSMKDLKPTENGDEKIWNLLSEDSKFENVHEGSCQTFNKDFLNDLNQARKKIFSSSLAVKEELFYASGEDSFSDDNIT